MVRLSTPTPSQALVKFCAILPPSPDGFPGVILLTIAYLAGLEQAGDNP
jgi:hypothetical protein